MIHILLSVSRTLPYITSRQYYFMTALDPKTAFNGSNTVSLNAVGFSAANDVSSTQQSEWCFVYFAWNIMKKINM